MRRRTPSKPVENSNRRQGRDIHAVLARYQHQESMRERMTRAELSEDIERAFLTSRVEYYGPDSDWEQQLRRWERQHPGWPIDRHLNERETS